MKRAKHNLSTLIAEPQAEVILKALFRVEPLPEVRHDKVNSLSQAIRTKTYRIDTRKLADCLIVSLLLGL